MTSRETELTVDTLRDRIDSNTTSASRLLFALVATSITVCYLCSDALGWLQPFERASSKESAAFRHRLESDIGELGPLLSLSDQLRSNGKVVRGYREFLRPFIALDEATTNAIRTADRSSPEYKSISPVDLDQARDVSTGLGALSVHLDFYTDDDLRTEGFGAFEHFLGIFVHPEATFDNEVILGQFHADARILEKLRQAVPVHEPWPASIYFRDYLRSRGDVPGVLAALDSARALVDPDRVVDRLIEFGSRNDVAPLSISGLQNFIDRGQFVAPSDTGGVERVQVSFVPIRLNRNILLVCAPLALMFLVALLQFQLTKRSRLLATLRHRLAPQEMELLASDWVPQGNLIRVLPSGHDTNELILGVCAFLGRCSPLVAQSLIIVFLTRLSLPGPLATIAWSISIASAGLMLLSLLYPERGTVRALLRTTRGRKPKA